MWKKALAFLGYSALNLVIALVVMAVIAVNFSDYIPEGLPAVFGIMALSLLLALPITFWWRYQLVHKDRLAVERKAREKAYEEELQKATLKAKSQPPGPIETVLIAIFYIGVGLVVLYVAYQLIASLPVSVAVILGAAIIGVCIIAASQI